MGLFLQGVSAGASAPLPPCESRLRARSGAMKDAVLSASEFDMGGIYTGGKSAWISAYAT